MAQRFRRNYIVAELDARVRGDCLGFNGSTESASEALSDPDCDGAAPGIARIVRAPSCFLANEKLR